MIFWYVLLINLIFFMIHDDDDDGGRAAKSSLCDCFPFDVRFGYDDPMWLCGKSITHFIPLLIKRKSSHMTLMRPDNKSIPAWLMLSQRKPQNLIRLHFGRRSGYRADSRAFHLADKSSLIKLIKKLMATRAWSELSVPYPATDRGWRNDGNFLINNFSAIPLLSPRYLFSSPLRPAKPKLDDFLIKTFLIIFSRSDGDDEIVPFRMPRRFTAPASSRRQLLEQ